MNPPPFIGNSTYFSNPPGTGQGLVPSSAGLLPGRPRAPIGNAPGNAFGNAPVSPVSPKDPLTIALSEPLATPGSRPTRPILPGRLTSMASLDDRVAGDNPNLPLDLFERHSDGTYRRVGSVGEQGGLMPEAPIPVPLHRMGWRTYLQIFGTLIASATATIASYNLYKRTNDANPNS